MTNFLVKKFIKNHSKTNDKIVRQKYGELSGVVGIIVNIFLSVSKIVTGLLFASISIMADGFNNLSDAASSIITLIGFRMAAKPADKDHPYGHQRIEYIAGLTIAFLILFIGFTLIKTSFGKIISPEETQFSVVAIGVLIFSIILKLWLWIFNNKLAKAINSSPIKATAKDSINDVVSTTAVLISFIISKLTGFSLEGYIGCIIGIVIIIGAIEVAKETIDLLVGTPPDKEMINKIHRDILARDKRVLGIHDLVVHNYGPNKYFATVHIEVDSKDDIMESHDMIDNIERWFAKNTNIELVVHLDPIIIGDDIVDLYKHKLREIVYNINENLSFHDFRMVSGTTHNNLIFDLVVPYNISKSKYEIEAEISNKVKEFDKNAFCVIKFDDCYDE